MIVADTSALVSLATGDSVRLVVGEFDVHTTATVIEELDATAEYDDSHGCAARTVLDQRDRVTVHGVERPEIESSRIDDGEATCIGIAAELDAAFLLTDDLRALPELQTLTATKVAISPIVLQALVKRDVLTRSEARRRLDSIADTRDWLGAPIYERARMLFAEPTPAQDN